ncbi:hypothetical protein Acr_13g0001050 [Actinidia rufa]|uniref:Reverse transcriptase Ty1/copia-type domain-containing protein n=1 Tax=Actinidia rufa TaxID=165716 RepID=A0A7J0FJ26_9ERIC|nr:hypothetical protein Acr_13g0001050 [Actinidia rufa]
MSGSDVDNVENVVVPPPRPCLDFFLSQHTPGARITYELLNGKNFAAWSRSIDNCTILGWLFNSMEPRIYHVFMYHDMVPLLWSSLTKMYAHARNEARIFELLPTVTDYFAYLQSRWVELAQYEPLSAFTTEGGIAARRLDRQHTYQFLMGLKPEFEALRTQIVNTTPMPSIFEAFAMLDGDERRHHLLQFPPPPVTDSTIPDQMALAASGSRFLWCLKLHPELRETFKRNKEKSKASPRTVAISETSYGSPAAPTATDLHQLQTQFQNQMEQLQLQFQTQLGSLMQQSPRPNPSPSTATLASGIPTALHVRSSNPSWVLDSGADDHMTGPEFEEDFWQGYEWNGLYYFGDPPDSLPSISLQASVLPINMVSSDNSPVPIPLNRMCVAERKNRSIMTVVRCLLCGMHVPKHFWDMAVLTATYLLNRTPSRILLGYSFLSKGYRCYDPFTSHMHNSFDVASPTLPPVLTSDPRHMYSRRPPASDPLPQSSPEFGDDASGIERMKQTLRKAFDTKDLGPLRYFLGIEVARSCRGVSLSQRKYVLDLLQDTDISFAVSVVSQFMHAPRTSHLDVVHHIFRYLKTCPGLGLFYTSGEQCGVSCFTDADYAGSKTEGGGCQTGEIVRVIY